MNKLQIKGTQEFLGINIPVIHGGFGEDKKVILAKTVAEIHEMEVKHINELINKNIEEFEFGVDLLDLKGSECFKVITTDLGIKVSNRTKNFYLLSEQGYMTLVMLMRTDKAKEIRKQLRREYFAMREIINSNEQLKAQLLLKLYNGGIDAVNAANELAKIESAEVAKPLNDKIEKMTPAVETLNTLINKESCWSVEVFAKVLNIPGMGRNNMFKWMREKSILKYNNIPYQNYAKYFEVKPINIPRAGITKLTTLINYNGIIYLHKRLVREGLISVKTIDEILEELNTYIKEDNTIISYKEQNELNNL